MIGGIALSVVVAVGLVGCRPPATVPAPVPIAASPPTPAPLEAPSVAPSHPGTVTFFDRDTGVSSARPVAEIPVTIAWVTVDGRQIAVVRVESTAAGGRREIFRYGADGALLDTTVAGP